MPHLKLLLTKWPSHRGMKKPKGSERRSILVNLSAIRNSLLVICPLFRSTYANRNLAIRSNLQRFCVSPSIISNLKTSRVTFRLVMARNWTRKTKAKHLKRSRLLQGSHRLQGILRTRKWASSRHRGWVQSNWSTLQWLPKPKARPLTMKCNRMTVWWTKCSVGLPWSGLPTQAPTLITSLPDGSTHWRSMLRMTIWCKAWSVWS